jgi:hypothetical protein
LAGALSATANAQSDALKQLYITAANVKTNIEGVRTFAAPPEGFNPLAASDVELATYGFPPRPNKQADPDHYALWERAMAAAKNRVSGELKPLPAGMHERMQASSASASIDPSTTLTTGPKQLATINGAGVFLTNALKTWSNTASLDDIWTMISVPVAQLPFANNYGCTESDYLSASFAGIDGELYFPGPGWVVNPELQGGVMSDYNCVYGTTSYYAYAEWGSGVAPFALNPGDVFYTEVHGFAPPNSGWVFLEDLTTLSYGTYTVAPDPLVKMVGHSAQWVVERPCCSGPGPVGAWPLANNISISFDGAAVLNTSNKLFYPGSQATSTYILTMRDDSNAQNIELVNQGSSGFQGQHSLFFQTTGCAYAGGCVP